MEENKREWIKIKDPKLLTALIQNTKLNEKGEMIPKKGDHITTTGLGRTSN